MEQQSVKPIADAAGGSEPTVKVQSNIKTIIKKIAHVIWRVIQVVFWLLAVVAYASGTLRQSIELHSVIMFLMVLFLPLGYYLLRRWRNNDKRKFYRGIVIVYYLLAHLLLLYMVWVIYLEVVSSRNPIYEDYIEPLVCRVMGGEMVSTGCGIANCTSDCHFPGRPRPACVGMGCEVDFLGL